MNRKINKKEANFAIQVVFSEVQTPRTTNLLYFNLDFLRKNFLIYRFIDYFLQIGITKLFFAKFEIYSLRFFHAIFKIIYFSKLLLQNSVVAENCVMNFGNLFFS